MHSEVNGDEDIKLKIYKQRNSKLDLKSVSEMWTVTQDDIEYKITYIKQITNGNGFHLDVRGIPLFYDKFRTSIIHYLYNGSLTATDYFSRVFEGTGYIFVLVNHSYAEEWEGFGKGQTRMELFKKGLDRYGYEFHIVGKTIYLKHQIGNDTNFEYRYKLNASNVSKAVDASALITHIKGFGNMEEGEDDYLNNAKLKREATSPLADIVGIREPKVVVDGRITRADTMDARLQREIDESLYITVEANLHDIRQMGYETAVPLKGDRTFLVDERIGFDAEIRVQSVTTTKDERNRITQCDVVFGSANVGKRYKANLSTLSKNIADLLAGRLQLSFDVLDNMAKDMLRKIQSVDSELLLDNGIFAIDKANPNNILGLNSAGMYISTDGGATARTVITAEGIVADAITTGTLRAIYIDGVEINGSEINGTEINGSEIYGAEIFGGTITGGTLYTDADNDHYISLKGSELISRGIQTRKWFGTSSQDHIRAMIYDGQFRVRNDDKGWSAYLSDMGISTQWDGSGDYIKEGVSGALELHSTRYSGEGQMGVTLYSSYRVALETNGGRIYLNPNGANVHVADARDNYYGISASTFSQSSERDLKRDIKSYDGDASSLVKDLQIQEYKRLTGGEETLFDQWQIGLIVDEAPREILADGSSVDLYSYVNIIAKSIQEILPRLDKLEGDQ